MTSSSYAINPGWRLVLLDMGLSPQRILKRARLPGDLFTGGATHLPAELYYALWLAAEEEADDVPLPVLLAQALSVEAFDPPIFAAICSPDFNRAVSRIAEYKPLICPLEIEIEQGTEHTTLLFRWPKGQSPPLAYGHSELFFWIALIRLATRTRVEPTRITSPCPPRLMGPYLDYAGIAITQADGWTISFTELDASRPFLTCNEPMWDFFEPTLRTRLSQLQAEVSTAERVRSLLLELLPAGDTSIETVCRRLAFSKRTLQRRLSDEKTSFKTLLSATREALARHYLVKSQLSSAEISFLLGYDDPNSFYRAFNSWTGQTPETVRAAARP